MSIETRVNPKVEGDELNRLFGDVYPDWSDADFDAVLSHAAFFVCGFSESELIGFAKVIWDGGEHGFLLDPTVAPSHRGRGFGKALVQTCVEECARRGIGWLHVDFEPSLEGFYRSCGSRSSKAGVMRIEHRCFS